MRCCRPVIVMLLTCAAWRTAVGVGNDTSADSDKALLISFIVNNSQIACFAMCGMYVAHGT